MRGRKRLRLWATWSSTMFGKQFVTACLALIAVCGRLDSPSAGGERRLVGEWSDPNRLEIRGSEAGAPEQERNTFQPDL